jgi:hypothetical protein
MTPEEYPCEGKFKDLSDPTMDGYWGCVYAEAGLRE